MIRIRVLLENSAVSSRFRPRHGLSIAIETGATELLLDVGPDGSFAANAAAMGYDLSRVGALVLSHSHSDHTGGLDRFCELNAAAEAFLFDSPDSRYYAALGPFKLPVGLRCGAPARGRIRTLAENRAIDARTWFIRNSCGERRKPAFNKTLYKWGAGGYERDDFRHEGILVVDDGELVVFNSCSHNGIYNSVASVKAAFPGKRIRGYVGGLHYSNPLSGAHEGKEELESLASFIEAEGIRLFTGHCTGRYCVGFLQERLGDRVVRLSSGSVLEA